MIFNVSGKAMPGLICGWKTEICWSSFKLENHSTNMKKLKEGVLTYLIMHLCTNYMKVIQVNVTLISGVSSAASSLPELSSTSPLLCSSVLSSAGGGLTSLLS